MNDALTSRLQNRCIKFWARLALVFALWPNFADAQEHDHYKLRVTCPSAVTVDGAALPSANAIVEVELDLAARDYPIKFCLPAFGQRFGERFSALEIWDKDVKTTAFVLDAQACSKAYEGRSPTRIRYRIEMRALSEEHFWAATSLSACVANGSLAIAGESLFVEIVENADDVKPVGTLVSIESQCEFFSSLDAHRQTETWSMTSNSEFWASDSFDLIRSYWGFGDYRMLTARAQNLALTLVTDKQWPVEVGVVGREVMAIVDQYAEIFGNKLPSSIVVFLFSAAFDAHLSDGFARPGGTILQMGQKAARDPLRRRILLAHELFHLINGEGVRYGLEDFAETAWFREGVTQYMAAKALERAGLLSRLGFLDMLAKSSAKLLDLRTETLLHTCYPDANFEARDDRAYHLGFVLAYGIEEQWRVYHTQLTLEGFWRELYAQWPRGARLSQADLQAALERYSGFDFTAFFEQFVKKSVLPPVELILARDGLCLRRSPVTKYELGMRYILNPKIARLVVGQVQDGMPAALAGLQVGDVIVPIANIDWRDASDKRLTRIRGAARRTLKMPSQASEAVNIWMEECSRDAWQSPP